MLLSEMEILNKDFRIESTTHAAKRMEERKIDESIVIDVVKELDVKALVYNNTGDEIAIIDQIHDIAVITEVRLNKIVIITVINRANIHIKDGTRLEQIA
jgi:hypothetical protein